MKSRYVLRAIAILTFYLLSAFTASAQKARKVAFPPGPCHQNTKVCLQQMNAQISKLRAYVAHVKPGDPVKFNPQPDPPGDPDPWYRRAGEAYRSLLAELSDLSDHAADVPIYMSSPPKANAGRAAISDAQDKLNSLALPAFGRNRASVDEALNSLSASVRRLSDSLATPLLRR
jgi:hypothetical protein